MAKLVENVHVDGRGWFGPSYPAAGDPPAGSVTNPNAWEDGEVPAAPKTQPQGQQSHGGGAGDEEPPPKAGAGSSEDAWRAYAQRHEVDLTGAETRADVIARVEAAGVRTE